MVVSHPLRRAVRIATGSDQQVVVLMVTALGHQAEEAESSQLRELRGVRRRPEDPQRLAAIL